MNRLVVKDGQARFSFDVTVEDVHFLGGNGADGHRSAAEIDQTLD